MIKQKLERECDNSECGKTFKKRKSTDKFCSPACFYKCNPQPKKEIVFTPAKPRAKIKPASEKREKENRQYTKDRREYLSLPENKICFIDGCGRRADTVEHRKGRKGFADDWALENNVPLLLDRRFWAPCCNAHNLELENNPELSKKYQLSKLHNGRKS